MPIDVKGNAHNGDSQATSSADIGFEAADGPASVEEDEAEEEYGVEECEEHGGGVELLFHLAVMDSKNRWI